MMAVLHVNNLSVSYRDFDLHPLSFEMTKGEILAVIGESGSGKTTLARAISCLLDDSATQSGQVFINGREIISMPERERKKLRMSSFSIAFQNSAELLNPTMKLRVHLQEILDRAYKRELQKARMRELMEFVGLSEKDLERYPKELSGGMAQKFLLASAIALEPELVILDEPTSSMDSGSRKDFVELVRNLNSDSKIAFLIITHDMKLAADLSSRLMVLYEGHVVETGETKAILESPRHPYTRGLLNASVSINPTKDIWGIRVDDSPKSTRQGCPFCRRCTQSLDSCQEQTPCLKTMEDGRQIACNRGGIIKLLEGRAISKSYGKQTVLKDVYVHIYSGEIVSLIGKSGAGKTTLAMILSGFDRFFSGGELLFCDKKADYDRLHRCRYGLQMVFQDSEASINPRMTVMDAVSEPGCLAKLPAEHIEAAVKGALVDVGLPNYDSFLSKKVKELSGGQKQRVSIARALTMEPALLIADEPTSMLDPSSSANLIRMLKMLQNKRGFSMLVITHDLEYALKISDRIYLLKNEKAHGVLPSDYVKTNLNKLFD